MLDGEETNEATGDTPQSIDIEVEAGINLDDFGPFSPVGYNGELQSKGVPLETLNDQNDPNHPIRREYLESPRADCLQIFSRRVNHRIPDTNCIT